MNAVGEIGKFIIDNQEILLNGAIVAGVIIVVIFIGKTISGFRRRGELIRNIDRNVSEINSTVKAIKDINEKNNDVIYIDNRSLKPENTEKTEEIKIQIPNIPEVETDAAENQNISETTEAVKERETQPARNLRYKFESRDCAVDRSGRVYTQEELEKQIKQ